MTQALSLAQKAEQAGEVPVGAVLVYQDQVIGAGFNQPISRCDPSAHAEILALRAGAQAFNNYRLPGSVLYVTLEPCWMCLGAMSHARIARLVYGASDPKKHWDPKAVHFEQVGGILAEPCGQLLKDFFQARR